MNLRDTVKRMGVLELAVLFAMVSVTGCATKHYVRNQTAPLIQHESELDKKTEANANDIHDVDDRAQGGIKQAQNAADAANQAAQDAAKAASGAQNTADLAVHRVDSLDSVVKGLDAYKPVADVTVTFGLNQSVLTKDDKEQLDSFAQQLTSASGFILEVTGGTDATGTAQYNYELSQRRANAVVEYLSVKYNIPVHRFYLIGIGKDKEVASNSTREGRRQNRRVEVQLLTNSNGQNTQSASAQPAGQ